jgi:hypothetical protein
VANALQVNGVSLGSSDTVNFNNSTPTAPSNGLNVTWNKSTVSTTDSVSAAVVGDGVATDCLVGTGVFLNCGPYVVILAANNYTNATTVFNPITDGGTPGTGEPQQFKFAVNSGSFYALDCELAFQGSATSAGPKFDLTSDSGSATWVYLSVDGATNSTAYSAQVVTALNSANTALGTLGAGTTNFVAHVKAGLSMNATTNVYLQGAANGSGTVTIIKGSSCKFWKTSAP